MNMKFGVRRFRWSRHSKKLNLFRAMYCDTDYLSALHRQQPFYNYWRINVVGTRLQSSFTLLCLLNFYPDFFWYHSHCFAASTAPFGLRS